MTVYFFLPCTSAQLQRMPTNLDGYLAWQFAETELNPFLGVYHWVLQTYLQLRRAGMNVCLTNEVPDEGIVLSHVDCLPYAIRSTAKRMVVAILVDREVLLPHAALHLTHNPEQHLHFGVSYQYMPPWPQIGLIKRDAARGDRFENIYFSGNRDNLHGYFGSTRFDDLLRQLQLRLTIPAPANWHDFSQADLVLAVRNFGDQEAHLNKPALKLFNAWQAGVPSIMGCESALRAEGRPGTDYLEATSEAEVERALTELARSAAMRRALVQAGHVAGAARDDAAILQHWLRLFDTVLFPRYMAWRKQPWTRLSFRLSGAIRERVLWRSRTRFTQRPIR